jgi:hypothetical protein
MEVDESFAEYVAVRWSMLYRLAVLLVGEDDADRLTQAALVQAYLEWADVEAAPSADDRVRAILAGTAGHEPPHELAADPDTTAPLEPTPQGRDRLWTTISALPPRQRTVLVLRHYEMLDDAEIGRAVKRSASEVRAEAGALEAGLDLAELRDELERRAEDAVVPLPPIAALVAQGHLARRQRVRRVTTRAVVVAAIVVVGVALATLLQSRSSDSPAPGAAEPTWVPPPFISQLPRGRPAEIAYAENNYLHLPGGRGIALDGNIATVVQTEHWAYVAYLSGKIVRVGLTTAELQTVAEVSGGQLVTDAAGDKVAWVAASTGRATVVVVPADGPPNGRIDNITTFPVKLRCCDNPFEINGITDDGHLIASLPAESRTWDWSFNGGGYVQEMSGLGNAVIHQVTARGLVAHYPPFQYALGQVLDGIFLQVSELAALDADFADPRGHRVVYADDEGEIHVREVDVRGRSRRPAQNIRMRLPTIDDGFAGVVWEDSGHVLLDLFDASMPGGSLVRCDVADGTCELADDLQSPHLLPR